MVLFSCLCSANAPPSEREELWSSSEMASPHWVRVVHSMRWWLTIGRSHHVGRYDRPHQSSSPLEHRMVSVFFHFSQHKMTLPFQWALSSILFVTLYLYEHDQIDELITSTNPGILFIHSLVYTFQRKKTILFYHKLAPFLLLFFLVMISHVVLQLH